MRKIALDVGDVRIGVAVSDPLGITAQGLTVIERVGIRKDCDKIMDLIKEYECDAVVIGLNKRLDGSDTPQTEKVYEFKRMLENKMRSSKMGHIPIVFHQHRLLILYRLLSDLNSSFFLLVLDIQILKKLILPAFLQS